MILWKKTWKEKIIDSILNFYLIKFEKINVCIFVTEIIRENFKNEQIEVYSYYLITYIYHDNNIIVDNNIIIIII